MNLADLPPGVPVTIVPSEPSEWATRFVRAEMADVLAWLGESAPDMRTAAEWLADARATAVVIPAPTVLPGAALVVTYVREEGPCVWCSRWVVRHRRTDVDPHPVACGPVHARQATIVIQPKTDRVPKPRHSSPDVCPRPDKIANRSKAEAKQHLSALREARGGKLPNTVVVYLCKCECWHVGDRAKTIRARVNKAQAAGERAIEAEKKRLGRRRHR